jgi:FkbM family methyltransferase
MKHQPNSLVVEVALSDIDGRQTLYLTQFPQCSSLLKPDMTRLAQYRVAPCFEVIQTVDVECRRYDSLHENRMVPAPDAIKLDVQGTEWQVLRGFGQLLHGCLGIEAECHFYPIYHGQALLHEVISYLEAFGLILRRLEPQSNFDGDLLEVNAFFTRKGDGLGVIGAAKLELIERAWQLTRPPAEVHPLVRQFCKNGPAN